MRGPLDPSRAIRDACGSAVRVRVRRDGGIAAGDDVLLRLPGAGAGTPVAGGRFPTRPRDVVAVVLRRSGRPALGPDVAFDPDSPGRVAVVVATPLPVGGRTVEGRTPRFRVAWAPGRGSWQDREDVLPPHGPLRTAFGRSQGEGSGCSA